jgi:MEKHLA domain
VKPYLSPEAAAYAALLAESFHRQTGQSLPHDPEQLWHHPQPLVSHGTEPDPIFRYANQAALALWQMDWQSFTGLPSRLSAEADPTVQSDRLNLLQTALAKGHVANYQGIRISATGKRFRISETLLWTVTDANGQTHGQAALIGKATPITA